MKNVESWPALFESESLERAHMVATCLSAMEYDVRLRCLRSDLEPTLDERRCDGPFAVQVQPQDFAQLAEVLEEILDEQDQFDHFLDSWHASSRRRERKLLVVMIIVVGTLAAVGAIEL